MIHISSDPIGEAYAYAVGYVDFSGNCFDVLTADYGVITIEQLPSVFVDAYGKRSAGRTDAISYRQALSEFITYGEIRS